MARYKGPVVDMDIHHNPQSDADFVDYLPKEWREYATTCVTNGVSLRPTPTAGLDSGFESQGHRSDTIVPGALHGSSYELCRDLLLDEMGTYRGMLLFNLGEYANRLNPEFGVAMCRAANDWNIDKWLDLDDRLYSGIVVAPTAPEVAVNEIGRLAGHPKLKAVLILGDSLKRPLGDPAFEPIYRAAVQHGLPIVTHPIDRNRIAGVPGSSLELTMQSGARGAHDIASLVTHGVFERYPDLKFVMCEYGMSWLPSLLWKLDSSYELLQLESPWVKTLPSEYVRKHIKLSTQPLEVVSGDTGSIDIMAMVDGIEDMLCFSSDYPHWSMDDFEFVAHHLPQGWHRKVFCDNACEVLGFPVPTETIEGGVRSTMEATR